MLQFPVNNSVDSDKQNFCLDDSIIEENHLIYSTQRTPEGTSVFECVVL